jgi:hypothetical protein
MSEVETYLDVAIMYAVVICLSLLALGVLLPGLVPR